MLYLLQTLVINCKLVLIEYFPRNVMISFFCKYVYIIFERILIHRQAFQHRINTTCQSITQPFILYAIKIVHCQGDIFRPLLGHLQALWENRSKSYLYFNALRDPKCTEI